MTGLSAQLDDAAKSSPDPAAVRLLFERLLETQGAGRILADEVVARAVAAVGGASRSLARLLVSDELALAVLAGDDPIDLSRAQNGDDLVRSRRLAFLAIARDDLCGTDVLETTGSRLSDLADGVLAAACRLAGAGEVGLAVVAMGKHGARELNYSSDVDIVFVAGDEADLAAATAAAREVVRLAGAAFRVDTDLRPEGRNGPLVRSLESYSAYWQKWAQPWEFQALLKARHSAGDVSTGEVFVARALESVWSRRFDADDLAQLRAMKGRAEEIVLRKGLSHRELKRGTGGIRDIEFAVQLLQLVHGQSDASLRARSTLDALAALAEGYVDPADASTLALAYRFLRTVEHRLQLIDEVRTHTVPEPGPARDHLVRVLGFGEPLAGRRRRSDRFDEVLSRYQSSVRSIHERLYFRPLLEVFAGTAGPTFVSETVATERLAAFGFREAERTRQALAELTRGLTRSSRLMQQLLPVLLGWLSETPDPDLGLLALRNFAGLPHQRDVVVASFRDSPELARRLCVILGTSRAIGDLALRHPDLALRLGSDAELAPPAEEALVEAAGGGRGEPSRSLRRLVGRETLRLAAGEILGVLPTSLVPRQLAALADAALTGALEAASPALPFAIVAVGRLGGAELSYGSDLDVLFLYEGSGPIDAAEGEATVARVMGVLNGATPAERIWTVDASLRPEGRKGPLARSLAAHREYHDRWLSAWERQALIRARPLAGDDDLLRRFMGLVEETVWERELSPDDVREIRRLKARTEKERIPAGEDPRFHLKLGRGSLADIEWTVQLLQLVHRVRGANTRLALAGLERAGALSREDASILETALSFLESTRNRWHLVGNYVSGAGGPATHTGSDSLPQSPEALRRLARSLGESPAELRENYRRVTRRARSVVERCFYEL